MGLFSDTGPVFYEKGFSDAFYHEGDQLARSRKHDKDRRARSNGQRVQCFTRSDREFTDNNKCRSGGYIGIYGGKLFPFVILGNTQRDDCRIQNDDECLRWRGGPQIADGRDADGFVQFYTNSACNFCRHHAAGGTAYEAVLQGSVRSRLYDDGDGISYPAVLHAACYHCFTFFLLLAGI